jgi:hypothetical protein
MELMEVYHQAMAKWIIARATSGKCEGSEFVFDLIELAIRKEATEILLTPVQESELIQVDFGRLHCYYRQPKITRAQFAYLAIYLVLIGNVAEEEARTERGDPMSVRAGNTDLGSVLFDNHLKRRWP